MVHSRIRIARIIARMNIGGPAIHVTLLTAGLDPGRFTSLLVSGTENPGEGSMLDFAASRGVHPVIIPEIVGEATFRPRDAKALAKLYHLFRRERPDIVDTHTAKAGFLGRLAAVLARVPVVVHTYHGHVLHGYYGPLRASILRRMERALARLTDAIVAVSEQTKRDLVEYGVAPPERIRVIPYGIELDQFLSSYTLRGEFRHELGLGDAERLVGIVGRIFPIKNHRLFLDAAARVAREMPDARFVIVGDGLLRQELRRRAEDLGIADRTIFTGWRRDLPRIYADLHVLAVSSNNEGAPFSVIEAMASGVPVVATRVGGLPELVEEGRTGYLVPPGDADAMASAILRVLGDPSAAFRMGEAASAGARERFSVQRLITDTAALYEELLVNRRVLEVQG